MTISTVLLVLIALVEIVVAIANCVLRPGRTLLFLNIALYLGFLLFLSVRAIGGAVECGCFGRISVSVWKMLAFDALVVLTLLTLVREARSGFGSMGPEFLGPVVLVLAVSIVFPSLQSTLQQQILSGVSVRPLSDDPILLDPLAGIDVKVQVEIANRTDRPIQVLNASGSWCVVQSYFAGGLFGLRPTR